MKKLYCIICGKYKKFEKIKISYFDIKNSWFKENMAEGSISQEEFRLKNIDETRNYLLEEIKQNELITKKHKKVCTTLNYIKHFLLLPSTITGCISISAFGSLICIPIGTTSSAIGLEICAITAGIKKYKSIIRKKGKGSMIKQYC